MISKEVRQVQLDLKFGEEIFTLGFPDGLCKIPLRDKEVALCKNDGGYRAEMFSMSSAFSLGCFLLPS